ncbi:MAG TPA: hypothetical protein VEJ40_06130 [Pseudolabrys sp.]|nr:hypothetical protein [Pseudolabrys sp.]
MSRKFAVLAAVLATFVLASHPADAQQRKIPPTIEVAGFWVGTAWTAVYFAINHWRTKWNADAAGISNVGAAAVTTAGCVVVSPMVASALLNRPLTYREAYILFGSCVIPIVGGWAVNEAFNKGWIWAPDEKPVHAAHHSKVKMAAAKPAVEVAGAATPAAAEAKPAPAVPAKAKVAAVRKIKKVAAAMPFDGLMAMH